MVLLGQGRTQRGGSCSPGAPALPPNRSLNNTNL